MGISNLYREKVEYPQYEFKFIGSKDASAKRLNKGEQDMFIRIFGASSMLIDVMENGHFNNRIENIPRGMQRLKTAFTMLKHVSEELMNTAPVDQAQHMSRQLSGMSYLTYVGRMSPLSRYKDMGRWMSFEELNWVASVCMDACKNCVVADKKEQKNCPVNRIMRLMPIDNDHADNISCSGWMEVFGEI